MWERGCTEKDSFSVYTMLHVTKMERTGVTTQHHWSKITQSPRVKWRKCVGKKGTLSVYKTYYT